MTAASEEAVTNYDTFVRRFMAHGADAAPRLKAVMDADPDLVLGHCARGFCFLILGRQELRPAAREALAAAQNTLETRGGTAREHMYVSALAAFCDGYFRQASDRLDRCLQENPCDGYAAKLVHAVRFMLGDSEGMLASTSAILPAWSDEVPDAPYLWGCHAFGLEETEQYGAAEDFGRRAVAHAGDDAWGFHAVAHVMEMQDRVDEGIGWLDSGAADLSGTGNLAYHIHWHKALFLLEQHRFDEILDLYDRAIRCNQTDDFRDVTNAVSLLVRLESAGVDVDDRWDELSDKAAKRTNDMALVFASLHYLATLIATGRWSDVHDHIANMRCVAELGEGDQARLFASVGLPYADALVRSYRHDGQLEAARSLAACLPRLRQVGGSHAQRDVFYRMVIDRLFATGAYDDYRALLTARVARRPDNRWAREKLAALADNPVHVAVTEAAE